jgi:hypothetical protein
MATTGANYMAKSINFENYDKIVKFDVIYINLKIIIDLGYCWSRKIQSIN